MAAARGRTIHSFGQAFTPVFVDGTEPAAPAAGQPTHVRSWGIPTQWFDRPARWNVVLLPLAGLLMATLLKG